MNGQRLRALRAMWTAIGIFPLRGLKYLVTGTPLREALVVLLLTWPAAHRTHLPIWLAILHV